MLAPGQHTISPEQLPLDPHEWLGYQRDLSALPQEPVRYKTTEGVEVRNEPSGAYGHLAHEVSLLQEEAGKYESDSRLGQRVRMAIHVRESALASLEDHGNDAKAAIKSLKQERKAAIRSGNGLTAENIDREISMIRRAKSDSYIGPRWRVSDVLQGRDPQFGERGFLGMVGRSILNSAVSYRSYASPFSNILLESMRSPSIREKHRKVIVKSIGQRALQGAARTSLTPVKVAQLAKGQRELDD